MELGSVHVPVLLQQVVEFIQCKEGGIYVDATIGAGGHAREILKRYPALAMLIGIDQDLQAVAVAKKNLNAFSNRVAIFHGNFQQIRDILSNIHITEVDGIIFDLGVSTFQLKDPLRGFSFNDNGPLDMRMDQSTTLQAKDLVNKLSVAKLASILHEFGEERWAKRIARHIHHRRMQQPITRTKDLAQIVVQAQPAGSHPKKIHPATRTFQALRIAVNNELTCLERGLDASIDLLKKEGRMCVISFHSLEDRLVKQKFKSWEKGCFCPPRIPQCICGGRQKMRILTRKPVVPNQDEKNNNPGSRSAKLRVGERV